MAKCSGVVTSKFYNMGGTVGALVVGQATGAAAGSGADNSDMVFCTKALEPHVVFVPVL